MKTIRPISARLTAVIVVIAAGIVAAGGAFVAVGTPTPALERVARAQQPVADHGAIDELDLSFWAGFPPAPAARPWVVVAGMAKVEGFSGAERTALLGGWVRPNRGVLDVEAPATTAVRTADGTVRVPTISAAAALSAWRASTDPETAEAARRDQPVRLVRADLVTMSIETDRGRLDVPGWSFHAAEGGSITWPAIAPSLLWRAGTPRRSAQIPSAVIDQTGRRIILAVTGEDTNPCQGTGDHWLTVEVDPAGAALIVTLTHHFTGPPMTLPPGAGCIHAYPDKPEQAVLTLPEPLGRRVLLGADGGAIAVTPA